MENKQVMVVIDKDGKEKEAEIIAAFRMENYKKDYILYTFNEIDENDMVRIYASTLIKKDDMYSFEAIATPEEWAAIKDIMRDAAHSSNNE